MWAIREFSDLQTTDLCLKIGSGQPGKPHADAVAYSSLIVRTVGGGWEMAIRVGPERTRCRSGKPLQRMAFRLGALGDHACSFQPGPRGAKGNNPSP